MNSNERNDLPSAQLGSSLAPLADRPDYVRPISFGEAIRKGRSTVMDIRKSGGIRKLTAWVMGRLITSFEYLGSYERGVTDFQLQMLAQRICAKYYYLTPDELDYFFVCFENGQYSKLYNNNGSVNPQDIMKSLIAYEHDLLVARGQVEEEQAQQAKSRQAAEEAKRPHGLEAWRLYCESHGLDPDTHRLPSVILHNVNDELYPDRDSRGIIKNK